MTLLSACRADVRATAPDWWQSEVVAIPLGVERNPAGGVHGDLTLTVGSCAHRSDSYYFDIDKSPTAPPSIEGALARLLDQWLLDLAQFDNGAVSLPFDLSDQCSAWLEVERREGEQVRVELGWTSVEGWSFVPSNYGAAAAKIGAFEAIAGAHFEARLDDMVNRIKELRDGFEADARKG